MIVNNLLDNSLKIASIFVDKYEKVYSFCNTINSYFWAEYWNNI